MSRESSRASGTYRAAASPIGLAALERYETFLAAAGLSYRRLSATEMEQELGTRFYQAGLHSPDCYLAQPAAVIRAMAKGLPSAVALYEHSPVVWLDLQLGKWRVLTPFQGVITTDKVVLANNAFAAKLGFARGQLASVYTYATSVKALLTRIGARYPRNKSGLGAFADPSVGQHLASYERWPSC